MNVGDILLKWFRGDVPHQYRITQEALKSFDTGDILLFSGTGMSSFIVKEFLSTEWSHCGLVFKPDRFSSHLPKHSCANHSLTDENYFFHVDNYGNFAYTTTASKLETKQQYIAHPIHGKNRKHNRNRSSFLKSKKRIENKTINDSIENVGENNEYLVRFAKHVAFVESEFSSTYNKDEDYEFSEAELKKYKVVHDTQKRLCYNIQKNFIDRNRQPCPWQQHNKCCFRCIIEMYDGIPLILESIRVNSDKLVDVLTGMKGKPGVRLVSLLDRINSSHEIEIAARKLLNPSVFERNLYSGPIPLPEIRCDLQHLLLQRVFPNVLNKNYESDKIEIISSFCRPPLSPDDDFSETDDDDDDNDDDDGVFSKNKRYRKEHMDSFFCSELVAFALMDMNLLNRQFPSRKYTPQDLSSEMPQNNVLNNGYEFSKELFFAHF